MRHKANFISRYWIMTTFISLQLLATYSYRPLYGAPTPTPDIATVPPLVLTPIPIPFPIITVQASPSPSPESASVATVVATSQPASTDVENSPSNEAETVPNQAEATQLTSNPTAIQTNGLTPAAPITGTVITEVLNMRQGPDTGAAILDKLAANTIVEILQRDASGHWLYVCCGAQTQQAGWVSAEFIQTNATVTSTAGPIKPPQTAPMSLGLALQIQPTPAFVWQGQALTLQFVVNNKGSLPLTNLRLRDDLPPELRFMTARASDDGQMQQTGQAEDGVIFTLLWPTLAAGAQVTATIVVQVVPTTPNGVFIKNLAVINSQEYGDVISGISIAMPPTTLPKF